MSNRVNPPKQLVLPKSIASNIELKKAFDDTHFILFQLWKRVGGGDDAIDNAEQNITSSSSRVSRNAARINSLELKEFEIINTTESLTTFQNQIIICKNTGSINITLDPEAIEGDEVHIKRSSDVVEVIGQVDGLINLTINVPLFSLHLVFNGTDWSQI
jgi:hypothetical protein